MLELLQINPAECNRLQSKASPHQLLHDDFIMTALKDMPDLCNKTFEEQQRILSAHMNHPNYPKEVNERSRKNPPPAPLGGFVLSTTQPTYIPSLTQCPLAFTQANAVPPPAHHSTGSRAGAPPISRVDPLPAHHNPALFPPPYYATLSPARSFEGIWFPE